MPSVTPPIITIKAHTMETYDIIQKSLRNDITVAAAAAALGLSERQIYRLRPKIKTRGIESLIHGNCGKTSNNAFSKKEKTRIKNLIERKYSDFGPTLAQEKLNDTHGIRVSPETLRKLMIDWKIWKPQPRKGNGEHREWRERRAHVGEMEQFDGCYHDWFEGRLEKCCLLASIDDASGDITGLLFVDWEGVFPSFRFWREYLTLHGKPCSIYLDRHSTYKINAKSLLDDPEARSQFELAMQ